MNEMIKHAVDAWNEAAVVCGWPVIRGLHSDRERKLQKLIRTYGMDQWNEGLAKAQASDFLCGKTERAEKYTSYRFNLDTMVRESFFIRLLEGCYDNREQAAPVSFKSSETILWEARLRNYKPGGMWLGIWGPPPSDPSCHAPKSAVEAWKQRHMAVH